VLLAEDHPINQRVISLMLEPFDVALTVAGDGEQALAAFQAGSFDLVLMDMQMPVMDGLEATRRIRALEAAEGRPRTPVAMLSANAMKEHVDQAREAGCDTHIAKPVRPEALVAAMEALIHPRPDAKQAAVA
jgi:CheY-like chemotaxis protein